MNGHLHLSALELHSIEGTETVGAAPEMTS